MDVADQVSQLRTGSSASDQVFLRVPFADDLLAYLVTDAPGLELGSHPRHVVRAHEFAEDAQVCSKLDSPARHVPLPLAHPHCVSGMNFM